MIFENKKNKKEEEKEEEKGKEEEKIIENMVIENENNKISKNGIPALEDDKLKHNKIRVYIYYNNYTKNLLKQIHDNYHIKKESSDMFNIIIDKISIVLILSLMSLNSCIFSFPSRVIISFKL